MRQKLLPLIALLVILSIGTDAPEPPTILLIGDSVTLAGYTEHNFARILQERLSNEAIVINAGVGGYRAPQAIAHYDEYAALHPNIVVIYFGTNDVKRIHIGDETWEEYQNALLKLATLAPHVIFVTPHRGRENPDTGYYLANVTRAASLVRSLGYPVADVYPLCCSEAQLIDYAHPNDEGHQIIADAIFPLIP